ncbi:peroxisome assembly protein 26 isoform X1 [Osmerus mordax]|uniref:peroxisome assembly protein 26 isoform X1 n=1 Tax=Osmerus mordax TaxID=8014 RepID=UPI003510912B
MSNSTSLVNTRCFGSEHHSPALNANIVRTHSLLDLASEQLMVLRDFRNALDTCERGLESLTDNDGEQEDCRYAEFKAALCILGIQALAELNQWRGVLQWIIQQYECPEKMPAKIMQMCILLYTKVGEQAMVQEAGRSWLHYPSNRSQTGFRTVAELYLLHVLTPLGLLEEARDMILGEVGSDAFTDDQKQTALDIVEDKKNQSPAQPPGPHCGSSPDVTARLATPQGSVVQKLKAVLRFLCRKLSVATVGSIPLRRVFLAFILLYMLFVRIDPALQSSFPWISKLLQILKHMWNVMFAPYYRTRAQSKQL